MEWLSYIAWFLGGALLANGVPHFVAGVSGSRFQSPFARPPGVGESSPTVNVLWGLLNLTLGYGFLSGIGEFETGLTGSALAALLGALLASVGLSMHFGRVRSS
jgi:hypothetical protein